MPFDSLCKLLSEKYPDRFAAWILGTPQATARVLKTELSIEPIRADFVSFLHLQTQILHLEFQTKLESNPPLAFRMLDYWVRLHRLYRVPIEQVVVILLPPAEDVIIPTLFEAENTRHRYRTICLWEQDPNVFLNDSALLPLASLTTKAPSEALLQAVAQRLSELEDPQRQETSGYVQLLAGLKFEKEVIRQIFQEGMMRESVIYQEILEEGRQEGRQKGRQEGQQSLILLLLQQRFGQLSSNICDRIANLTPEQLEHLALALLNFSSVEDLAAWLQQNA
jgi:predicted transposase/invertase (TIGR01784 family)